ncbi:hypothetical protein ROA7450_01100 [Roseovarius albus]|uniref:Uncharacterized protein n=1 Tax=Roseovarius albus TaxID=1247867 RepID=A0A1X6YPG5_9RHOB|nr:hypothetical protein ROA7450_01100 [Roseovarius albus]
MENYEHHMLDWRGILIVICSALCSEGAKQLL